MSAMDAGLAELIELIEGAKERGLAEALERTEGGDLLWGCMQLEICIYIFSRN